MSGILIPIAKGVGVGLCILGAAFLVRVAWLVIAGP